jgi:hypothetical protein
MYVLYIHAYVHIDRCVRERERERERARERERERELFKEFKEFLICAVNAS